MCPYAKLLHFSKLGAVKLSYFDVYVLLWHYGASPCDRGDVKHLTLQRTKILTFVFFCFFFAFA